MVAKWLFYSRQCQTSFTTKLELLFYNRYNEKERSDTMSLISLLTLAIIIVILITIATIISVNRAYAFKHTVDDKPKNSFHSYDE